MSAYAEQLHIGRVIAATGLAAARGASENATVGSWADLARAAEVPAVPTPRLDAIGTGGSARFARCRADHNRYPNEFLG